MQGHPNWEINEVWIPERDEQRAIEEMLNNQAESIHKIYRTPKTTKMEYYIVESPEESPRKDRDPISIQT